MENQILVQYKHVNIYQQEQLVLKDVNLRVVTGEFIYLLGKVGSGKSTFLKSLYREVPIVEGDAEVLGHDIINMKNNNVPYLRRKIGIVFQDFQLLNDRSVNANLEFVLRATGWKEQEAIDEQIHEVLSQVGMKNKGNKRPHQLSGGEQQRIAIARALLNVPDIIIADEPTGHLDPETGRELIELLYSIRLSGTTVIMATHNLNWVNLYPGRIIRVENERMTDTTANITYIPEEEEFSEDIELNTNTADDEEEIMPSM
jgi:cell division transport system ATP-binding protein